MSRKRPEGGRQRVNLLEKYTSYRDLANLSRESIEQIAEDVRELIISVVTRNGGHLASSLGTVELTIALLRKFDPATDKIVFDVGHQMYAYKILTGRRDRFATLRTWGGISGFPKRAESPFDHFEAGHSSTSLSAALGFAKARDILGQDHHVVAVIGDASLMNGMAFEALNYTKEAKTKVIFVLNDNTMSISPRIGGFATQLARLSSSTTYGWLKKAIKDSFHSMPKGEALEHVVSRMKDQIKSMVKPENIFDELDINYWGPFDGHNVLEIETVLEMAKRYDKPVLIHVLTKKGKGYQKAEEQPTRFHGLSPLQDAKCGTVTATAGISWSGAAGEALIRMAEKDKRIVCLTAAMKDGSKLNAFEERFPNRFYDVGIAEEHLMTMAAGMAAGGLRPFVFIYSTFLQRAMDQLVHDIAMQNLPVVCAVDRAGLIGEDGETHQGVLDVSWGRSIPNMALLAPRDIDDLDVMFRNALRRTGPTMIRYSRGTAPQSLCRSSPPVNVDHIGPEVLYSGEEWALIGYGSTVPILLEARTLAVKQGLPAPAVIDLRQIKPLDEATLSRVLLGHDRVVVLEDGFTISGAGEAISSLASDLGSVVRVIRMGVPDAFIPHGSVEKQRVFCGMTAESVVAAYSLEKERTNRPIACL